MIEILSKVTHYPLGGKEISEVMQGLLGKYRSMVLELQHDIFLLNQSNEILKLNYQNLSKDVDDKMNKKIKERKISKSGNITNKMILEDVRQKIPRYENERGPWVSIDGDQREDTHDYESDDNIDKSDKYDNKYPKKKDNNNKADNDNNNFNKKNGDSDINLHLVYEKLFLEMDEKIKKEHENKIREKDFEFNKILEFKFNETNGIMKNKELFFKEQYSLLKQECDTANDDRLKLFEISELLHLSYTNLKNENEMLSREILHSGASGCPCLILIFVSIYVSVYVCVCVCLSVCVSL